MIDFVESPMFFQASAYNSDGDRQDGVELCLAQLQARGYLQIPEGGFLGVGADEEDPRPPKENDPMAAVYEANPDDFPFGFIVKKLAAEGSDDAPYDWSGWPEDLDLSFLDRADRSDSPDPPSPARQPEPSLAPTVHNIDD